MVANKLDLFDKLSEYVVSIKNNKLDVFDKDNLYRYYCDLIGVKFDTFNQYDFIKIDNKMELMKKLLNDYDRRVNK